MDACREQNVEKNSDIFILIGKCVMRCLMRKLSYKMRIIFCEMHRYVFINVTSSLENASLRGG
jgi:hypothetical protein